jgi:hypothetical protein
MSALLLWSNLAFTQVGTVRESSADSHDEIHSHIDSVYQLSSELETNLDRSQFDLEALLDLLDYDDKQIVEFVQQQINFQAYEGVLRGPQGTLISRSGNSLDQSLLLARLLKDAGYDARIARGKLQIDQSKALIQSMAIDTSWPSPFRQNSENHLILNKILSNSGYTAESAREEMLKYTENARPEISTEQSRINHVIEAVQTALTPLETELNSATFAETLIEEQTDYFWVEYQLSQGSGWQPVHPAFGIAKAPQLEVNEYYADEIPAQLQHRVRVQAFIETQLGGRKSTVPLMSPWERPAANAAHIPQVLTLAPVTDFEARGQLDIEAGLNSATFYALYMNGALAPGASVFSLEGLVGPPEALTGQGAFLGTVSKKGISAADALSNLGSDEKDKESIGGLNRLWFEFSIIAPGGNITTISRNVLQTADDGQKLVHGRKVDRESLRRELQTAFFQTRELAVATGPVNPAYSMALGLSLVEETKRSIEKLQQLEKQGALAPTSQAIQQVKPPPDSRAFRFIGMANGSTGNSIAIASFLAQPMIVTLNRGLSRKNGNLNRFEQTDIVFNVRRSLEFSTQSAEQSIQQSVSQGVWDTYFEVLSNRKPDESAAQISAFERLSSRLENLRYIPPDEKSELEKLGLDFSSELLAKNELQAGFGLLIPDGVSVEYPAWWRVDTATGTVTGMAVGPGGYGGVTSTEWIIKLISLSISSAYMIHGIWNCYENYQGIALYCCLVDTILTGVLIAAMTHIITAIIVEMLATTGTVIIPGAAPEAGLIAKQNSRMIAAIVALFVTASGRTGLKLADFRLKVCGTIADT